MHYVMVDEGVAPVAAMGEDPAVLESWKAGRPLAHPPEATLRYVLDPNRPGRRKSMYYALGIPIMRTSLFHVLQQAGVHNIQTFPASIEDPLTGETTQDYVAYNIVGLVACADLSRSTTFGTAASGKGDLDFESLFIDESRASGHKLFRLAECVSAVVVDEDVKAAIENAGFEGFVFYGPGEWSG